MMMVIAIRGNIITSTIIMIIHNIITACDPTANFAAVTFSGWLASLVSSFESAPFVLSEAFSNASFCHWKPL